MPDSLQLLSFDSLAQRILYRYAFSFADFVPIESKTVSVEAQHNFYDFCGSIVRGIAENPSVLGLSTEHPDEWLGAHEVMSMRPELYKVRNTCQKTFNDLFNLLLNAGNLGEVRGRQLILRLSDAPKVTAKMLTLFRKFLEHYGLFTEKDSDSLYFSFPDFPETLSAWQLLAAKCGEYPRPQYQAVRFALWVHHDDGSYFLERIRTLLNLDEGFFEYITDKYLEKGYTPRFVINEYSTSCSFTKDISGLSITYATLWPTVRFVNESSIGIKAALEHTGELDDGIKIQLIQFCKSCNDCMICTKGGKNSQFTVNMRCGDNVYRLCPEFVQMEWYNHDISKEKIDFMLQLNELQERFGKNWKKK